MMTQANTALEPKRHAKTRSGQAARAARPNGGAAAAARVDPASFRDAILAKLTYSIGKDLSARAKAGLLLLARVPHRAALVRGARQPRPPRHGPRGARRA